ncbi:hypothetical protein SAMN06296416_105159 [Pseudoxanthomonas wuyuanensis]|uniref:Uncharacterized protein n=1 Tax=Pseudoxanthomonas wuyuanensis TaxID=1073196 RepID=A0A286D8B1_9GAMM|nr:hypothetical protein [Pseudoxanthomonas wuyuanensis]SOD54886.1 hypothetical protein SAMN06296416_105159 [Pseudoxanthomonas wuyuanensis]
MSVPTPPAPPRPSQLVTVAAKISIVLGIAGTLYGVFQAALITLVMGRGWLQQMLTRAHGEDMPPAADWLLANLPTIGWALAASSALFLAVAIGLLKRHEWARWGFIVFMVLGALWNFAGVWLTVHVFDWLQTMPLFADLPDMQAELLQMRWMSLATSVVTATAFAALHGWIVWKLCTPAIRAEFVR